MSVTSTLRSRTSRVSSSSTKSSGVTRVRISGTYACMRGSLPSSTRFRSNRPESLPKKWRRRSSIWAVFPGTPSSISIPRTSPNTIAFACVSMRGTLWPRHRCLAAARLGRPPRSNLRRPHSMISARNSWARTRC
jgi:hypothetical protein